MAARSTSRVAVECESLLHWAYRDELSKRYTSAAEGCWRGIERIGSLGGSAYDRSSPQRYDFGEPDPDALLIERAVSALPDAIIDWEASKQTVMGHLAFLVERRDVLLVRPFKVAALVTMHASMGTRPRWYEDDPTPRMVEPTKGSKAHGAIVGKCEGKNRYSDGSYCPLRWEPSGLTIAIARLEYWAWRYGLVQLAASLVLNRREALPPSAPEFPWIGEREPVRKIWTAGEKINRALPLKPERERTGPTGSSQRARPVRKIPID